MLASELAKINETVRAVRDENKSLIQEFGDTQENLLAQIRDNGAMTVLNTRGAPMIVPGNLLKAGKQMQAQRTAIKEEQTNKVNQDRNLRKRARKTGVPEVLVNDDNEEVQRGLELRERARRLAANEETQKTDQSI